MWVATIRADGSPHLTPVWFVFVDDRIWIATGRGSVKTRNVSARPRVAVSLEDGDSPVVAEGSVAVLGLPFPTPVVDAFCAKYDWDIGSGTDGDVGGEIALWEVTVERWLLGGPD